LPHGADAERGAGGGSAGATRYRLAWCKIVPPGAVYTDPIPLGNFELPLRQHGVAAHFDQDRIVLLMCSGCGAARGPRRAPRSAVGSPTAMWQCEAVFAPGAGAIISSSRNRVPSHSTTSAGRARRNRGVSWRRWNEHSRAPSSAQPFYPTLASVSARSGFTIQIEGAPCRETEQLGSIRGSANAAPGRIARPRHHVGGQHADRSYSPRASTRALVP